MIKSVLSILFPILFFLTNCGQTQTPEQNRQIKNSPQEDKTKDISVGGRCDQCDIMYEGMPAFDKINHTATLANENEAGERMEITGRVMMADQAAPAQNIILYFYHTDASGHYSPAANQTAGRRNGHLRGWVKTDEEGRFTIYSVRPAPYPESNIPAHIHILVKEPGKTVYYIDEVWFDDDPLVTEKLKAGAEKRGGNLIVHPAKNNENTWTGNLNITLGLNIPGYK